MDKDIIAWQLDVIETLRSWMIEAIQLSNPSFFVSGASSAKNLAYSDQPLLHLSSILLPRQGVEKDRLTMLRL